MAKRARILYVDDDPDLLRLFRLSLGTDFDIDGASSGEQALAQLKDHPDYAVVVSDMRMPNMNGAELLGQVRQMQPDTIRVLLTGDADLDSAMRAVNEGYVYRYLTKPCPRDQMLEMLHHAVQEHHRQLARTRPAQESALNPEGSGRTAVHHRDLVAGDIVAGRYEVLNRLGSGGSAKVYRCFDSVLEQLVALKLFPANMSRCREERIRREIVLARSLNHPNIIRSYDIGVDAGRPFITMELLTGHDLAQELTPGGLPIPRAVDYLLQACAGLQYAHCQSVIHRDIKPENLFIANDGSLRIMDFGLAKQTTASPLTTPDAMAGTMHYMSPEQIDDLSSVTAATDIYALGAVGYELLTGQAPFDYDNLPELVRAQKYECAVPPADVRPDIAPHVSDAIMRALAKSAADRFENCAAMAEALWG